jgi:hypothetical protein
MVFCIKLYFGEHHPHFFQLKLLIFFTDFHRFFQHKSGKYRQKASGWFNISWSDFFSLNCEILFRNLIKDGPRFRNLIKDGPPRIARLALKLNSFCWGNRLNRIIDIDRLTSLLRSSSAASMSSSSASAEAAAAASFSLFLSRNIDTPPLFWNNKKVIFSMGWQVKQRPTDLKSLICDHEFK